MTDTFRGIPAATGSALAPAFVLPVTAIVPHERIQGTPDQEQAVFDAAIPKAASQLTALADKVRAEMGEDEANIFMAHVAFATDPALIEMATTAIAQGKSAEFAVTSAFGTFKELLLASGDEYNMARAADLDDVCDRVVRIIEGREEPNDIPTERSIIVAQELTPSQTASLPKHMMAGLVTAKGSATSHAAILARASGIPAIVGCEGIMAAVKPGVLIGMNGTTGDTLVNPSDIDQMEIQLRIEREHTRKALLAEYVGTPGQTKDGQMVELAANIGSADDLEIALEYGAQGSGLVRTEMVFQNKTIAPSAGDQAEFYTQCLKTFPGSRVVIRTLDAGADKPLPFVQRAQEDNPALGVRGIRLSLREPDLFDAQIEGMLLAHKETLGTGDAGKLCIMFPLVSTVDEFVRAKQRVFAVADRLQVNIEAVQIGMMVEVPIAALSIEQLAKHADFFSIGTNDLLQYLFAADRLDAQLADMASHLDPGVIRLLSEVVRQAHDGDAWVGICGEAASDPIMAVIATGIGVRELSMTATAIGEVKDLLRHVTMADCVKAADFASTSRSKQDVITAVERVIAEAKGRLNE